MSEHRFPIQEAEEPCAFPNDWEREHDHGECQSNYADWLAEQSQPDFDATVAALRDPDSRPAALATIEHITEIRWLDRLADALLLASEHPIIGLDADALKALIRRHCC